jgi:hypothetical protein
MLWIEPPSMSTDPAATGEPPAAAATAKEDVRLGTAFAGVCEGDQDAHRDTILARITAALSALGDGSGGLRLRLLLASANARLSLNAEAPASRYLLGMHDQEDLCEWRESAARAIEDLSRVEEMLDRWPEPANEEQEAEYAALGDDLELLSAFAGVFLALTEKDRPEPDVMVEALSDLSSYLEAEDEPLARSATLWQAVALNRLGRTDRATSLLALPLRAPGTSPTELFIRLQRLACLADRGDLEAAMVLALRMEEASTRWYRDERQQDEARRTCLWVRVGFIDRYVERLRELRRAEQLERWERMRDHAAEALMEDGKPAFVARLGRAMPMVVDAEEVLQDVAKLLAESTRGPDAEGVPVKQPLPQATPTTQTAPAG